MDIFEELTDAIDTADPPALCVMLLGLKDQMETLAEKMEQDDVPIGVSIGKLMGCISVITLVLERHIRE